MGKREVVVRWFEKLWKMTDNRLKKKAASKTAQDRGQKRIVSAETI
jgi:hypothetical protein